MYSSIALLALVVSAVLALAPPEVTPGPRSPAHHQDRLKIYELQRRAAELYGRQEAGDLSFCFGTNSICVQSNELNDACSIYDSTTDLTQWYQCLCTNGYVSTREACGWCNDAWGIDQLDGINEINSGQCTSYSFTIAPVPQSVLALQTSYNSTWTGTLLGATGKVGAGGSSSTSSSALRSASSKSSAAVTTTSSPSSDRGGIGTAIGGGGNQQSSTSSAVTIITLGGDGAAQTVTETVSGGGNTASSTPTSQSANNNSASGAVVTRTNVGVIVSILTFGALGCWLL